MASTSSVAQGAAGSRTRAQSVRWCFEVPTSFEGTANDEARRWTLKAVASSALRMSVAGAMRVRSVAKASHCPASRAMPR